MQEPNQQSNNRSSQIGFPPSTEAYDRNRDSGGPNEVLSFCQNEYEANRVRLPFHVPPIALRVPSLMAFFWSSTIGGVCLPAMA